MVVIFFRPYFLILLNLSIISLTLSSNLFSQVGDPFDVLNKELNERIEIDDQEDENKSAQELLAEAFMLQADERLLDARSKLLKALRKDPKEYKTYIALANYYLIHVGHFKLSLKYIKRGAQIFEEKYGKAPYQDSLLQTFHADILSILSQARLNLDDYAGALKPLERFESLGYFSPWHASSKAWILMKLERFDEAIKTAKIGLLFGGNLGSTRNVLAILLSMTGKRQEALEIFRRAIDFELSLGEMGQAATPLNNAGEVYKESFMEEQAKSSWQRAIRLPDGCEHVLPSLNLTFLYIEETDYGAAEDTLNNFETCIAKYPLRNGEEHLALVHLARGRIALHTGRINDALDHFDAALIRKQWFGKIGTTNDDMLAATYASYAQALKVKNNYLKFKLHKTIWNRLASVKERIKNYVKARWFFRRALQVLTEDLNFFEDLYIRHTDSMLEYPTLGSVSAYLSSNSLKERIRNEIEVDTRPKAKLYYNAYLGENYLNNFKKAAGLNLLNQVIKDARPTHDRALKKHCLGLILRKLKFGSPEYLRISQMLFQISAPAIRNYGAYLPVHAANLPPKVVKRLRRVGIWPQNDKNLFFKVFYSLENGEHIFRFESTKPAIGDSRVKSVDLNIAANNFANSIFQLQGE